MIFISTDQLLLINLLLLMVLISFDQVLLMN